MEDYSAALVALRDRLAAGLTAPFHTEQNIPVCGLPPPLSVTI